MTEYVILGTGVAGIGAAEAIRNIDKKGTITFIGEDPHGYYSRPGLAYLLTGEVEQSQLYPFRPEDYKNLDAHFWRGSVTSILPQLGQVQMGDGKRISYDRLLIAVGASATRLKVPGANLDGVVKLDTMEDTQRIIALAKKAHTAVVVGGGITALELAEGLAMRKVKVHLLIRNNRYWSNVLDETESEIVQHRLKEDKIILHFESELDSIQEKKGKVAGVTLKDGKQIACDILAYGIGIQPRMGLAKEAGISCDRGILTDEHLRTNIPSIYAAGDVAQVFDPVSGRAVIDSLWSPARDQGRIAGTNMAGKSMAYRKSISFNVTRLAGLTTTIIGTVGVSSGRDDEDMSIARGDSETWRDLPDAIIAQGGFEINHLRVMVSDKNIVGAIVMGDQKLSTPLQAIVRDRIDISPIRDQLLAPNARIAEILVNFWTQVHSNRNNGTPSAAAAKAGLREVSVR